MKMIGGVVRLGKVPRLRWWRGVVVVVEVGVGREKWEITVASLPPSGVKSGTVSPVYPSSLQEPQKRCEGNWAGAQQQQQWEGECGRGRGGEREREMCRCRWRALETRGTLSSLAFSSLFIRPCYNIFLLRCRLIACHGTVGIRCGIIGGKYNQVE